MMNKIYAMTSNFSQVILPIAVFGGFGLAALAFVENLSFRNRLCEKVSFFYKLLSKVTRKFQVSSYVLF